MQSTDFQTQQEKNSVIDKREYQLQRESKKTVSIIVISLALFMGLSVFFLIFNNALMVKQKQLQIKHDTVFVSKPKQVAIKKVNNTGLDIVIKVSKDYRKYFVSYKSYYTPSKYYTCIDQITFDQFMTIQEGDTIHKSK